MRRCFVELDEFRGGLMHGDFSRLAPSFDRQLIERLDALALAEALTCASFLGRTDIAEWLLARGVDPAGGNGTGLDALHWAVNRGQLEAVRLLLCHNAPLETRNMYGTTVLGTAVWSAINEPRPDHPQIIEELFAAGANADGVELPTGDERIDAHLRRR